MLSEGSAANFRGVPANACPACGGRVLNVQAVFEDYDIAAWFMDASCAACGALVTAPCPPDRPEEYWPLEDAAPGDVS